MKPLPIAQIQFEVYNIEESPLHQIVKKLIYKKILDLEPYNFNYVYTSIPVEGVLMETCSPHGRVTPIFIEFQGNCDACFGNKNDIYTSKI